MSITITNSWIFFTSLLSSGSMSGRFRIPKVRTCNNSDQIPQVGMQFLVQHGKFLQEIPVASSAFPRRKLRRQKVFTRPRLLSRRPAPCGSAWRSDSIFLIVRRSRTLCRIVPPASANICDCPCKIRALTPAIPHRPAFPPPAWKIRLPQKDRRRRQPTHLFLFRSSSYSSGASSLRSVSYIFFPRPSIVYSTATSQARFHSRLSRFRNPDGRNTVHSTVKIGTV